MNQFNLLSKLAVDGLRQGEPVRFQAKGRSMHPHIRDGDIIVVYPVALDSLRIGDVILYTTSQENVVVHRVIKIDKKERRKNVLARGDAIRSSPESVDIKNILGTVVSIERNGREKNQTGRFARTGNFLYVRLWPFTKISWVFGKILSLFDKNFFVQDSSASFLSVINKYNSQEEVRFHSHVVSRGLEDWEYSILKSLKTGAKILNVGCGAGREAIAFAKRGYQVTGIDISPEMIDHAKKNAIDERLEIEFIVQNVAELDFPVQSFDCVLFSRGVYSHVPTRRIRVQTLKDIKKILAPDGALFFSAHYRDSKIFSRVQVVGIFRRIRNFLFKNKFETEPGDLMVRTVSEVSIPESLCFCHLFSGSEEIRAEIKAAGLTVSQVGDFDVWCAKP